MSPQSNLALQAPQPGQLDRRPAAEPSAPSRHLRLVHSAAGSVPPSDHSLPASGEWRLTVRGRLVLLGLAALACLLFGLLFGNVAGTGPSASAARVPAAVAGAVQAGAVQADPAVAVVKPGAVVAGGQPGTAVAVVQPGAAVAVVQPGDTLWSIAGRLAPNADRRVTVARLIALNHLHSVDLVPGEQLTLPS